jgi:hypothetical protein
MPHRNANILKRALREIARLTAPERGVYRHPPASRCHEIATDALGDDLYSTSIADRVSELEATLWANIHGMGSDGPCWCMYIQVCHPPDDPQDKIKLTDGHTDECWQAKRVMADRIKEM